jgi:flagellar M-ring protein FliF
LNDYSSLVKYSALLVLFILVYLLMIRPIQKRALSTAIPLLAGHPLMQIEPESAATSESASSLAQRSLILKKQLAEFVRAEPESSTSAVRNWLREEAP